MAASEVPPLPLWERHRPPLAAVLNKTPKRSFGHRPPLEAVFKQNAEAKLRLCRLVDAIRVRDFPGSKTFNVSARTETPHPARTCVRATFSRKGRRKPCSGWANQPKNLLTLIWQMTAGFPSQALQHLRSEQREINHIEPAQDAVDDGPEYRVVRGIGDGNGERRAKADAVFRSLNAGHVVAISVHAFPMPRCSASSEKAAFDSRRRRPSKRPPSPLVSLRARFRAFAISRRGVCRARRCPRPS
jgi:hypothetical protein